MTERRSRALLVASALGVWSLALSPARADRVHLDGGGTVETFNWWWDGDRLLYETPVGTVGLPRSMVLRIEATKAGERAPAPTPAPAHDADPAATHETPDDEDEPAPGTIEVPYEVGQVLNEARRALDSGNYEEAARLYEEGLRIAEPELQLPRVGYALSHMALGQDQLALSIVLDGLARDPRDPVLLELLGDLYNRRERVEDALHAWQEAFRDAPSDRLRDKIEKGQRELDVARFYSFGSSAHFNLRFDGRVDEELSRAVTDYLEELYGQLASAWRHAPPQPITVLLYPTEEFRDVTQTPEWVGGVYDGKIRVPLGGVKNLDPAAQTVLVHELTHAVVHSKSRGHCPRWLHEGLAQRAEGRELSRAGRDHVLEQLDGLDPDEWESRGFSYPVALSLVQYLEHREGFATLVTLIELLGEGERVDDALQTLYGVDYERLCRDWAAWFIANQGAS